MSAHTPYPAVLADHDIGSIIFNISGAYDAPGTNLWAIARKVEQETLHRVYSHMRNADILEAKVVQDRERSEYDDFEDVPPYHVLREKAEKGE